MQDRQTPFGLLLARLMRTNQMSSRTLAAKLGVSHSFIHLILSGRRRSLTENRWPQLLLAFPELSEVDLIRASRQSARDATVIPLWRLHPGGLTAEAIEQLISAVEAGNAPPPELITSILAWASACPTD